ncbi:predicted protein [Plenodomus lingam JN3]|uniref:Predicted protein n=1 Tax=Leptosphaeria maculans (strain JN3 / isolate v23.1.3 / race Av1-4-5-6-7-8) TaxID=985895 RepID=E5ABP1_LEPMJ|nr:predicted protein [Plenodomus lingam JN3]CBY01082.1 predicted protein [Plenodomus lingam JN3]
MWIATQYAMSIDSHVDTLPQPLVGYNAGLYVPYVQYYTGTVRPSQHLLCVAINSGAKRVRKRTEKERSGKEMRVAFFFFE